MTEVLWISGYPTPAEPIAGIFFRTQARALVRQGVDLTVMAPLPAAPWPLPLLRRQWAGYAQAPRHEVDEGVDVRRIRYPNVPGQPHWAIPDRFMAASAWRDRGSWRGARLVHGHYALQGLAAWRLARRARIPLALTFHGDDMNTWPDDHPRRRDELRAAVRDAALVIGVSSALVDRIRDFAGVEALHLPLGVDPDELAAVRPRTEARAGLQISDDQVVVLFVGFLYQAKGVREVATALLRLGPPFRGVFIGAGAELGFGSGERGAPETLDYRGQQPHDVALEWMSAADVLVLPSYGEGLPTVLVEAGFLGLPVIASRVGGIPDLLGGGERGTLLPDISGNSVTAALTSFVADRGRARARAEKLRTYVRERYDVNRNAAALLGHYRAITPALIGPTRVPGDTGHGETDPK